MALMTFALLARQQSIEKQKTHWKVFWYPRPKQSLLLVIAFSSGMLLTGCGDEEYASLEEAQERVCSSPPCPQLCLECVNQRWASLVSIDKETIHHWFQHCADASKKVLLWKVGRSESWMNSAVMFGSFWAILPPVQSVRFSMRTGDFDVTGVMEAVLAQIWCVKKTAWNTLSSRRDHHLPRLNLPWQHAAQMQKADFWMFWWLCIYHSRFSLEMLHLSWLYISIC